MTKTDYETIVLKTIRRLHNASFIDLENAFETANADFRGNLNLEIGGNRIFWTGWCDDAFNALLDLWNGDYIAPEPCDAAVYRQAQAYEHLTQNKPYAPKWESVVFCEVRHRQLMPLDKQLLKIMIADYVAEHEPATFADITEQISSDTYYSPFVHGDCELHGKNSSIILFDGLSRELTDVLTELVQQGTLRLEPCSPERYGDTAPKLPTAHYECCYHTKHFISKEIYVNKE